MTMIMMIIVMTVDMIIGKISPHNHGNIEDDNDDDDDDDDDDDNDTGYDSW